MISPDGLPCFGPSYWLSWLRCCSWLVPRSVLTGLRCCYLLCWLTICCNLDPFRASLLPYTRSVLFCFHSLFAFVFFSTVVSLPPLALSLVDAAPCRCFYLFTYFRRPTSFGSLDCFCYHLFAWLPIGSSVSLSSSYSLIGFLFSVVAFFPRFVLILVLLLLPRSIASIPCSTINFVMLFGYYVFASLVCYCFVTLP